MSAFFIHRPVLAIVCNAMIILLGIMAWVHVPVREYPKVSLPILSVQAYYPNASAEAVESEVAIPLEQALAGVEGLKSLESDSSYEQVKIQLRFKEGFPIDRALARTRDALSTAQGFLPKEVKSPTLNQEASRNEAFLYISFSQESLGQPDTRPVEPGISSGAKASTPADLERARLCEFVSTHVRDRFKNIPDVAKAEVWGDIFAMKVNLDPRKLYHYGVSPDRVISVLESYKVSLPVGRLYGEIPITLSPKLSNADAFKNVILKHNAGVPVRLCDVANVSLGTHANLRVRINGHVGVVLGLTQTEDGNLLRISKEVREFMKQLRHELPIGMHAEILYDKADFIRASLSSLVRALLEAVALVTAVTWLFLRQFRPIGIPLAAIPVSLIGILATLPLWGFSLNLLTLLALLLAIGIVVDDAIVVLENTQRHIDSGLSPFIAARQSSHELLMPIIAMTGTLVSAFLPLLCMSGLIGQLFKEFAWVLIGTVILSGIVALTLSPMMSARLLRRGEQHSLLWNRFQELYRRCLLQLLGTRSGTWGMVVLLALIGLCAYLFLGLNQVTVPREDRGIIFTDSRALSNAEIDTFERYMCAVEAVTKGIPEIENSLTFTSRENGNVVLCLKPWEKRRRDVYSLIEQIEGSVRHVPLQAFVGTQETGLPGLDGGSEKLEFFLQTTLDYAAFHPALQALQQKCDMSGLLVDFNSQPKLNSQGYEAQFDLAKLSILDLKLSSVARAAQVMFDRYDHLNFIRNDCMYPVLLRSCFPATSLNEIYVPMLEGKSVSIGTFGKIVGNMLPQNRLRYNQVRSSSVSVKCASGVSMDKGVQCFEKLARETMPSDTSIAYGQSILKLQEGRSQAIILWVLAILCTYGLLAMQFESFMDPLLVLCTVPLAATGGALALRLFGDTLNIFSQIGFITLIGLITKHGILLVDFTKKGLAAGNQPLQAVLDAATLRLRPILMTTLAMFLGILPLAYSGGAGSEARHSIAYVILGGLSLGTFITLLLLPALCYGRWRNHTIGTQ